jgi:hypothetical protein
MPNVIKSKLPLAKSSPQQVKNLSKSKVATATPSPQQSAGPLDTPDNGKILANASIGDSRHDFHEKFGTIRKDIQENIVYYNESLPTGADPLAPFEHEILSSVVKSIDAVSTQKYTPIIEPNLTTDNKTWFYDFGPQPGTIVTVRDQPYHVRRCQVKDLLSVSKPILGGKAKKTWSDTYVGAKKFTEDLDIANNSVFVIDFAAVSFNTIMTNGEAKETHRKASASEPKKTLYYVYTSELENDPAGKTRYDDKMFRFNADTPHTLISCIPSALQMDGQASSLSNVNYLYNWISDSKNPYENFFTKYNYELSELYLDKKSKSKTFITNVKITDPEKNMSTQPIENSGKANSIGSLAKLLESVLSFFNKQSKKNVKEIEKNTFSMNTSFLQKRSGDWLQVLLCLVLKNRNLKTYGTTPVIENVQKQFLDIYFVTHDRIAMAFALLMGVNVIFTHGDSQSAYSYKVLNEKQETMRTNELFDDIKTKSAANGELQKIKQKYLDYIDSYNSKIYTFVPQCDVSSDISATCNSLNASINNTIANQSTHFSSTMVLNATRRIFTKAMQHCYLKVVFPNIETFRVDVNAFDVPAFLTKLNNIGDGDIQEKKKCIVEYNEFMAKCRTVENMLTMYIGPANASGTSANTKFDVTSAVNKLRAQPSYKAAETWTWDITQGQRYYERLIDAVADTNYRNDKNLFLYNLQNLDEACKKSIAEVYGNLYVKLPEIQTIYAAQTPSTNNSTVNRQKFTNVVQSFCVEILLNCCPTPPSLTQAGKSVDEIITEFIKKTIIPRGTLFSTQPKENNLKAGLNYYPFISEVNIIDENQKVVTDQAGLVNSVDIDIVETTQDNFADVDVDAAKNLGEPLQQGGSPIRITNARTSGPTGAERADLAIPMNTFIIQQNPREAIGPLLNMHLAHNIASAESFHLLRNFSRNIADVRAISSAISYTSEISSAFTRGISGYLMGQMGRIFIMNPENLQEYLASIEQSQAEREQTNYEDYEINSQGTTIRDSRPTGQNESSFNEITRNVNPRLLLPESQQQQEMVGGSSEKDSLSSEEEIKLIQDVLMDNSICFHPSLPIYIMGDAYLSFAQNDDIEESLEYEFCIKYFKLLKKCQQQLASSYANENNNKENKIKAYIIGMGLKQLFFTANIDDDGHQKCYEALGMTESEYFPISNLSSTISYMSSGRVVQSDEEKTIGLRILESPIFTDYIRAVNPKQIFDEPLSNNEIINRKMLIFKARNFLIETGQKIIADRTGQSGQVAEGNGEGNAPLSTTEPIPLSVENDQAKGVISKPVLKKPFDYRTLDQMPRDAFGQSSNFGAPISVGAIGGKKKQKKSRHVKRANKTHKKRENKNSGKHTRKHKKIHKKKFTRKHHNK